MSRSKKTTILKTSAIGQSEIFNNPGRQIKQLPIVIKPKKLALLIHYFFTGQVYSTAYIVNGVFSWNDKLYQNFKRNMMIDKAKHFMNVSQRVAEKLVDKIQPKRA